MRVNVVLPKFFDYPSGGYKVHFQYANELSRRGHQVTVVLPITVEKRPSSLDLVKLAAMKTRMIVFRKSALSWFVFDSRVRVVIIAALSARLLPPADATILTAWQTSANMGERFPDNGELFQIVYDYEFWMSDAGARSRIETSLKRPDVHLIATSTVVAKMLISIGRDPIATITAGLQEGEFALDAPIEGRGNVVVFPYRTELAKDMATALAAVALIQSEESGVSVECFGDDPVEPLPFGVVHHGHVSNAELRALYNRACVFLLTSRYEGWGLPAAEAMACGAAVISTKNGGIEDFLEDDENGLLVEVGNWEAVAESVLRLLRDAATRIRLAERGVQVASRMTVQNSCDELERILKSIVEDVPDHSL